MVRRIAYRIDLIGGGRQDRTADLRVTNPFWPFCSSSHSVAECRKTPVSTAHSANSIFALCRSETRPGINPTATKTATKKTPPLRTRRDGAL